MAEAATQTSKGAATDKSVIEERIVSAIDAMGMRYRQWLVLLLCMLIAAIDGYDIQSIAFAAPSLAAMWHLEPAALTAIFSASGVGILIGAVFQGPVSDRLGRRPILLVCLFLFSLLSLVTVFCTNLTELFAVRVAIGLALGAAVPNLIAIAAESSTSTMRARSVALVTAGFPVGGMLGGFLASYLLAVADWRAIFIAGAVVPAVLFVIAFKALPESILLVAGRLARGAQDLTSRDRNLAMLKQSIARLGLAIDVGTMHHEAPAGVPVRQASWLDLFRGGRLSDTCGLWLTTFINQVLFYFLLSWLPITLLSAGLPASRTVIPGAMLNLGSLIGGATLSWLADRTSIRLVLALNFCAAAAFCLLLGVNLESGLAVLMIMAALLGVSIGGGQLALNALAAVSYPTDLRSTGVGGASLAGRFGSIIGPILGGILVSAQFDVGMRFMALAPLGLVAALTAYLLHRRIGRLSASQSRPAPELA